MKAGIFRANKPAVVGEPDMPHTIAEVAKEKGARLLRRGVDWQYKVQDNGWRFSDAQGVLASLPLPQVPQPNAATALAALRASGLAVSEQAIRDGIQNALLPGRFQIVSESPRLILDVAHNPHAAAYLAGRLKSLPKPGACWRLSVCFMIKISAARWPAWRVWSIAGIVLLWKGRAARLLSS